MTRLVPGSMAPDAVVYASHGAMHLADTWRDRPVVLAFLRHFG